MSKADLTLAIESFKLPTPSEIELIRNTKELKHALEILKIIKDQLEADEDVYIPDCNDRIVNIIRISLNKYGWNALLPNRLLRPDYY